MDWINRPFFPTSTPKTEQTFDFRLKDGKYVRLSTSPGLHLVDAANGAGKSSLLNAIIDFSADTYDWPTEDIDTLRSVFRGHTRIVDVFAVIYPDLGDVYGQLGGPMATKSQVIARLSKSLGDHLGPELTKYWMTYLERLAQKWDSEYVPSSGERAIIALLRCMISLNNTVRLIVIDEGDSPLDQAVRTAWTESVKHLSRSLSVYLVSHRLLNVPETLSYVASGHFLGYSHDTKAGRVINFQMTATTNGVGEVRGLGNIGRMLVDEVSLCISALAHTHPRYQQLKGLDFQIYAESARTKVEDVTSGSLSIALALDDLLAIKDGRKPRQGLAASGRVLADGSVTRVAYLPEKVAAARSSANIRDVLTCNDIRHLRELIAT